MVTLFELYGFDSEKVQKGEIKKIILDNWKDIEKMMLPEALAYRLVKTSMDRYILICMKKLTDRTCLLPG